MDISKHIEQLNEEQGLRKYAKFSLDDAFQKNNDRNLINTMYMVVMDGSYVFKDRMEFYTNNLSIDDIKKAYFKNIELLEDDLKWFDGEDYENERQNLENFKAYFKYLFN